MKFCSTEVYLTGGVASLIDFQIWKVHTRWPKASQGSRRLPADFSDIMPVNIGQKR